MVVQTVVMLVTTFVTISDLEVVVDLGSQVQVVDIAAVLSFGQPFASSIPGV